jgi:hypothetical protein
MNVARSGLWDLAHTYTLAIYRSSASVRGLDRYQLGLTGLLIAAFCAWALLIRRTSGNGRFRAPWLYCTALVLALFAARIPTFLPSALNQDESQFLAGAMKLAHDPVFWRAVDGGSSGPFNYYPLLLLSLAGLGFDFPTARLLNILCIGGAIAFVYLIGRLFLPEWCARLTALPALAAAMNFRAPTMLHYSSECFPTLLTAAASWLLLSNQTAEEPKRWKYFTLAVLAAILPLAKLQAAPAGATLGIGAMTGIFVRGRREKWSLAGWLAAGHVFILATILVSIAAFGIGDVVRNSYVTGNILYADTYSGGGQTARWFAEYIFSRPDLYWFEIGALVWGIGALGYGVSRRANQPAGFPVFFALALFAANVYAIYRPMRHIGHYLLFLLFPLALVSVSAFGYIYRQGAKARPAPIWPALLFIAVQIAAPLALRSWNCESGSWMAMASRWPNPGGAAETLGRLAKPGDPVAIWGWDPQYFVQTGTIPAARDSVTGGQLQGGPLREYYRRRFMDDLRRTPPVVFADAVGPGHVPFSDRAAFGYESFPELRDYVAANFRFVSDAEGVRFYRAIGR